MLEEEIIRKHDTGVNPFKTPDGYFDSFTSRLMERMEREGLIETPAKPQQTEAKVVKMNPFRRAMRYAAAAVVAGVCIGTGTYLYTHKDTAGQTLGGEGIEIAMSDEALDDALDYEMDYEILNNSQIAYYLTEAY